MKLPPFPTFIQMRDWQLRALTTYHQAELKNFNGFITPGGGKTLWSLRAGHDLMSNDTCREMNVVVHTDHLRNQWFAAAEWLGVPITVWTYQQIAKDPRWVHSEVSRSRRALVVFDEIHHAADKQQWGDALALAFQDAHRRIGLTGTPFRNDEKRIRYVRYVNGVGQTDYNYSYSEALKDGIVRPVFFPLIGGEAHWKIGDQEFTKLMVDRLSQAESAQRLKTLLNPRGKWLSATIEHAHHKLMEVRQTHPDAGGLIVVTDQADAEAVARLIERVTATKPEVAISNYNDASERITAFKESDTPWLVAVKMISEGVDIPRLRVGVYATNVTTELFFRQWVGRYVRVQPGLEEQSAYLFLPHDPILAEYARTFAEQRQHVVRMLDAERREAATARSAPTAQVLELLGATATIGDVIAGGESFTQAELIAASELKTSLGLGYLPNEVVAKIMRSMRQGVPS